MCSDDSGPKVLGPLGPFSLKPSENTLVFGLFLRALPSGSLIGSLATTNTARYLGGPTNDWEQMGHRHVFHDMVFADILV